MFDVEVCIKNRVPLTKLLEIESSSLETGCEAETLYNRRLIRINLTGVWDLAHGKYHIFLDELVGVIIHEYLHEFFHVNAIPQYEKLIAQLSITLSVLSLGRLIGATDREDEDIKAYEQWLHSHFRY